MDPLKLVFIDKGVEEFGLNELLSSEAWNLGKGTFGTSYKTHLEERGSFIAVKRIKCTSCLPEKEFIEKVDELGKMVHENLLPIKAYLCEKGEERLLLTEYMNMGSLALLLHGPRNLLKEQNMEHLPESLSGNGAGSKMLLSWKVRCNIIYGVARAVRYLHSKGPNIYHENIKSTNVLINNAFNAFLSDYGISHLLKSRSEVLITSAYSAPEVSNPQEISQKSDVFSFGVLLMEILTGKQPTNASTGNKEILDMPKWMRSMLQEKSALDVFDSSVLVTKDKEREDQMMELLQLSLCCTFQNPKSRPTMVAVTRQIEVTCKFMVSL